MTKPPTTFDEGEPSTSRGYPANLPYPLEATEYCDWRAGYDHDGQVDDDGELKDA